MRIEETVYEGDAAAFVTPSGAVELATIIKKVTTPGLGGMLDWAELYVLDRTGTKHREIYNWDAFIEINSEYEV